MYEAVAPILALFLIGTIVAVVLGVISNQIKKNGNASPTRFKGYFKDLLNDIRQDEINFEAESKEIIEMAKYKSSKQEAQKPEKGSEALKKAKYEFSKAAKQEDFGSGHAKTKSQEGAAAKHKNINYYEADEDDEVTEIFEDQDILKKLVIGDIIMTPKFKKSNYRNFLR
ncbi:MAG TPA: hypothetical protein VIL24_04300 [Clostridia bacterium]